VSFGNPGPYPTPSITVITSGGAEVGGPPYLKYHRFQPSYEDVIDTHVYEDGGASYVSRNDQAPIVFLFFYDGLTTEQVVILDDHRSDAHGPFYGFELTDPRNGDVFTNVHYLPDGWDEDHRLINTINTRTIRLVWRP
jgi:hypothetical protein